MLGMFPMLNFLNFLKPVLCDAFAAPKGTTTSHNTGGFWSLGGSKNMLNMHANTHTEKTSPKQNNVTVHSRAEY